MKISGKSWKLYMLAALVILGLILAVWRPFDIDALISSGEALGDHLFFRLGVILLMVILFTFGLPGSLGVWLLAPFNPPLVAALLLVAGSTGGALGAYGLSARLGSDWEPQGLSRKIYKLLQRRGDFLTQCALRTFPGFPHSVINYACGVLRVSLPTYLAATCIGHFIKWGIYASALHGVTDAVTDGSPLGFRDLWPLFALTALLLGGAGLKWYVSKSLKDDDT